MQSNTAAQISTIAAKPILKWAGGKTQMLGELLPKVPSSYGRYIEPFSVVVPCFLHCSPKMLSLQIVTLS